MRINALVAALGITTILLVGAACGDHEADSAPSPGSRLLEGDAEATAQPEQVEESTSVVSPLPTDGDADEDSLKRSQPELSNELRSSKERAAPSATAVEESTSVVSPVPTDGDADEDSLKPSQPELSDELRSSKERAAPSASDVDISELVRGNSTFAFELYRNLKDTDGNLFFSPHSISMALAMPYVGARGETELQMAEALSFSLPQDRLHPALNALDQKLASRGDEGQWFKLNLVNAVWGQHGCAFDEEFLEVLAESYGAGVRPLDFIQEPEESRTTINDWVSDQTEGKIKDLIPQDAIYELTRMVLTNAIYFNARWSFVFFPGETRDLPFHLIDGSTVDVPMMSQEESFGYFQGDEYQAVELGYGRGEMSMVILLPDQGRFREFEDALDADLVSEATEGLERVMISLTMPKFEFESSFDLVNDLEAMGMPDAFDEDKANFSGQGMRGCPGSDLRLSVSGVFHKSFVLVDEEGTEAAAATTVVVKGESRRVPQYEVSVVRPFIFLIRDVETGANLFVGRVLDPSG